MKPTFGQRFKALFGLSGREGSWRGPFYGQGENGNWFELGALDNGFQRNLNLDSHTIRQIPVVSGARLLYRNAFSQLRPEHHRYGDDGKITSVQTSAAARILVQPNSYESGAEFNARVIDAMIMHGECAIWAMRNNRSEVEELHILTSRTWSPQVDTETKAIFYAINHTGELLSPTDATMIVPARDICHLKWATPRHSLIGESPLVAVGLAAGINVALSQSQAVFFQQMRRPSGILETEETLTADQVKQLKETFESAAAGAAKGRMPLLQNGVKFQPITMSSQDAEVISALRMSNEEIARAMGVPPPMLGDLSQGTLTSTEQLVSAWMAFSLGGLIERYERSLDRLFGFNSRRDRIEMDTSGLLRTDMAARMDALGKGLMSGVLTPNEARRKEGLSPIDGGDDAFMQRQQTPVSALAALAQQELQEQTQPDPEPTPPPLSAEEQKALAGVYLRKAMQ